MLPERIHSPARPETKKRQNRFSEARSKWGPRKAALQALRGEEGQGSAVRNVQRTFRTERTLPRRQPPLIRPPPGEVKVMPG